MAKKVMRTLTAGLLFMAFIAACGSPAIRDSAAPEGGHSETGAATKAADGGHSETVATKAADGAHTEPVATMAATKAADGAHTETVATLAATKAASAENAANSVTGKVTYRERITLPAASVITVQVQDVSRADAPATVLGESKITVGDKAPPYDFSVKIDPAKIDPKARYAVSIRIENAGKLLFINTTMTPVITQGASMDVGTVVLTKVG